MQKGKTDLHKKLAELVTSESKIVVHINCRKRFTDRPIYQYLSRSSDYQLTMCLIGKKISFCVKRVVTNGVESLEKQ